MRIALAALLSLFVHHAAIAGDASRLDEGVTLSITAGSPGVFAKEPGVF